VRTHIGWFVALQLEVAPDSTLYDPGWRGANWRGGYDLYVDPRDGILKRSRSDKAYRREAQRRRQERLAQRAQAEQIVLGPLHDLQRISGVWYEIEFARFSTDGTSLMQARTPNARECEVYDVVRCAVVTEGERYAVSKRQLTTKELRKYGVQNLQD
jgi:hypothetical protein